ncbi:hypothetical protein BSKO_06760 [Bryopsis sp. KO-2023]|nr:hypothetical protein BSKO_06760 [Bryopsis sp. KO-2023]
MSVTNLPKRAPPTIEIPPGEDLVSGGEEAEGDGEEAEGDEEEEDGDEEEEEESSESDDDGEKEGAAEGEEHRSIARLYLETMRAFLQATEISKQIEIAYKIGRAHGVPDHKNAISGGGVQALHQKINNIISNPKTASSHYRIMAFFLVYRYSVAGPDGCLADPKEFMDFFWEWDAGKIKRDGKPIYFLDVMDGRKAAHVAKNGRGDPSCRYTVRCVTALNALQQLQYYLMQQLPAVQLSTDADVKELIRGRRRRAPEDKKNKFIDRQRNVPVPKSYLLNSIREKADHFWLQNSIVGLRNRAHTLTHTCSFKRFKDGSEWELADMFPLQYDQELPGSGPQPIDCLYLLQWQHKTRRDDAPEDWNCFIRSADVRSCGVGSLSTYFVARNYLQGEKFWPIDGPKPNWYPIKVFPPVNDNTKALSEATMYSQKKNMLYCVGMLGTHVNHSDRKAGALRARMLDIDTIDITMIGFWGRNVLHESYLKVLAPSVVAKLAGFVDAKSYYLPRNHFDPFESDDEEIRQMAHSVWPFIDHKVFVERIEEKAQLRGDDADTSSKNFLATMQLLRRVFWQDLPHLHQFDPTHNIFKIQPVVEHWEAFLRWKKQQLSAPPENFPDTADNISRAVVARQMQQDKKIDKMLSIVERLEEKIDGKQRRVLTKGERLLQRVAPEPVEGLQITKKALGKETDYPIKVLPNLENLSVEDVWREWHHGGELVPMPLYQAERWRAPGRKGYFNSAIKNGMQRRRETVRFIRHLVLKEEEAGELRPVGLFKAFARAKELQNRGNKKAGGIYMLWKTAISGQRHLWSIPETVGRDEEWALIECGPPPPPQAPDALVPAAAPMLHPVLRPAPETIHVDVSPGAASAPLEISFPVAPVVVDISTPEHG